MTKLFTIFSLSILLLSCNEKKINFITYSNLGDSIIMSTQSLLLKNLNQAIGNNNYVNAVSFCSINALELTNSSINSSEIINIQRLTDNNRNAKNKIIETIDKDIFNYFKTNKKDTIIVSKNHIAYYKPIKIMMPTCLKCHGTSNEIDIKALDTIQKIYNSKNAIDYKIGDLRGMWKVTFAKK